MTPVLTVENERKEQKMNHRLVLLRVIAMTFAILLMTGCGAASPTPNALLPTPTELVIPTPVPQAVLPRRIVAPPTVTAWPTATPTLDPTQAIETLTVEPSPTLPPPIDRPFLMRIDRISVIPGRGTLLQGRVANGTLQANSGVEILGPQDRSFSARVAAILVSNAPRDQVTVGDYASILVSGIAASDLSPGLLLAAAGAFESYEEALLQL
jgi:hypothetical protein